jgi:hypothetical protein
MSEIDRQMKIRGYSKESGDPDLFIALHGGIQPKMDFADWEYLEDQYEQYWEKRRLDIIQYEDDMLIVDFIDNEKKTLVYRAIAYALISLEPTPEEREKKINEAVTKILENFPPL